PVAPTAPQPASAPDLRRKPHAGRGTDGVMLWLAGVLVASVGAFTGVAHADPPFPVMSKPAPDFALTDQDGRSIRLSQFHGKLVLLTFFYTNCTDVCPLTTAARVGDAAPTRQLRILPMYSRTRHNSARIPWGRPRPAGAPGCPASAGALSRARDWSAPQPSPRFQTVLRDSVRCRPLRPPAG